VSVSRNTSYNLVGAAVPIVLALVTVPAYLHLVGVDRYGVLAIAWLLLGYFGLFDLGLSRATAHRIAAQRDDSEAERAATLWTAIAANAAMGLVGAAVLWPVSHWYFATQFEASISLRAEMITAVPLLALSVPVATMTGVLLGALQGRERFLETNVISVTSTTLFQLFPLGVAWFNGPDIFWLLLSALAARVVALGALWRSCRRHVAGSHGFRFDREQMRKLMGFGGWVAMAAMLAPMLVMADRFIIGAALSAAAVAIYTIPFQLAQRLSVIPTALGNALFPRLSASGGEERVALGTKASRALACLMTLPVLGGIFLLDPFLDLWVGHGLGVQAAPIGKILFIGYWANAFAIVPYIRLQAQGRPDVVTKLLLLQIIPYLLLLYFGLDRLALAGAALAFTIRCIVDYGLLSFAADRQFPAIRLIAANLVLLALATLASIRFPLPSLAGGACLIALSAIAATMGWMQLPPDIRHQLQAMLRRMRGVRTA
jgi:O-antigen/teichoic acid export membrane protein